MQACFRCAGFVLPLTASAVVGLSVTSASAQSRYRLEIIQPPPSATGVYAQALNNSNEVTGGASFQGQTHPFVYRDRASTALYEIEGTHTSGMALNDRAHITGWMYEWGVVWPQAYLWDGTTNHWLVDPDESYTYAQGINAHDHVVGFYFPPNAHANGDAFVVIDGEYRNLGGGNATDISDNGIIVGEDNRYFGDTTVWEPDGHGGWTRTVLDGQIALSINADGTAFCGAGPLQGYFDSPVLWTRANNTWVRTDIGSWDPLETHAVANGVNNAQQVVGDFESFDEGDRAWIYENGEVHWLNDLLADEANKWEIVRAQAINESGVILVRISEVNSYVERSALLIPTALTMLAPRGDGAGAPNELIATSAAPGAHVYFTFGTATGQRNVRGCPGVNLGVRSPQIIGSAVADAHREARLMIDIPRAAKGRTVFLQAVDRTNCEPSNVLRITLN